MVVVFDEEQSVEETEPIEELSGKLSMQHMDDKLLHSVIESDKKTVEKAELLQEAANRNIGAFTPDLAYNNMVKNFHTVQQLYGPKLIKLLTGYYPEQVERNLNIPEFRKELKEAIEKNIEQLKKDKLLTPEGYISEAGQELGSTTLLKQLDQFITKDKIGEKQNKRAKHYGERAETRTYKRGDRYKDLHLKRSVHNAIKRRHSALHVNDLVIAEREGKGRISLVLALDASSSMKGTKIEMGKKASVALAHRALEDKDRVGLIVFGSTVKKSIPPTNDFETLLKAITTIKATKQTDFAVMLERAVELFEPGDHTKHVLIITDGAPTVGDDPQQKTLKAVSIAKSCGITISIIGIQLDKDAEKLCNQITQLGGGRFTLVKKLDQLGNIALEDYYALH